MRRTKILTKKNQVILYKKLTDYLKEILSDEENYSTFEDLYQEAKRVKSYGNIRYLTPSLITEWLQGLPIGTAYATYDICVMIMDFLGLDKSYVGKLGDDDSIYIESQTDIDSYYWDTLGEIIYQQHLESLYKKRKTSGGVVMNKYQKGKEKTRNENGKDRKTSGGVGMEDFKIGNFATIQDFVGYAEAYYLPLLDKLSEKNSVITDEDRNLLAFLHSDLTSFVNNYNEV